MPFQIFNFSRQSTAIHSATYLLPLTLKDQIYFTGGEKLKQLSSFLEFIFHPNQSYALYSSTQDEFRLLHDLKHDHVPSAPPHSYIKILYKVYLKLHFKKSNLLTVITQS